MGVPSGASAVARASPTVIPHEHWKTTTFTGALRLTGMTAPTVLDGAMNGVALLAYIEQALAPTLNPGMS